MLCACESEKTVGDRTQAVCVCFKEKVKGVQLRDCE